jgi:N-acetylmuramoyl-L-alanine amidase
MPANSLLLRLVEVYRGENIRHPNLRAVTLAQWMLESRRATSKLAKEHYNFGGLKWRKELVPFATKISYKANDGVGFYCKFATLESFINGYWAFLSHARYSGWEEHADDAEDFIRFIGPIYTPTKNYAGKVLALVSEAEGLLSAPPAPPHAWLAAAAPAGAATTLGTIVIDPGHGGTTSHVKVWPTVPFDL